MEKKGKCDGKKPVCSTCESAGSPCEWPDPELDGRKHKKMSNSTRVKKESEGGRDRAQTQGGRGTPVTEDEDHHYYQQHQHSHSKKHYGGGLGDPLSNGHGHGHSLNGTELYPPPPPSSSSHRPPRYSHHSHSHTGTDRHSPVSPQSFAHPGLPSHAHSQHSSSRSAPHTPHNIIHPGPPPPGPPASHHGHAQSPLDVLLAAALPGHHSQWAGPGPSSSRSQPHPAAQSLGVGVRDSGLGGTASDGMDVPMEYNSSSSSSRSLGPLNTNATQSNEPPLVLHYNRPFGPTAIQPGLEQISIAFRAPIPGSRCASPAPGGGDSSTSPSSTTTTSIPDLLNFSTLNSSFSFEPIHYTPAPTYFPESPSTTTTTLTVTSSETPYDPASDIPKPIVLQKLIPLFFERMGSHFPFLTEGGLLSNVDHEDPGRRVTAPLIINAVCALGARFSDIPIMRSQARDTTQSPATYGIPFAEKMKQLLVPLLGFPTTNTVAALLFLAYFSFGLNNEGALWMYSGMALRMAQDLGLHQDVGPRVKKDEAQRASDRLLWWSCFILDRTLAFGTGRPVTVKDREIKASLPTEEEILLVQQADRHLESDMIGGVDVGMGVGGVGASSKAPSPFPYHVKMFQLYGALAETINVVEPSWKPPKVDSVSLKDGANGKEGREGRDKKEKEGKDAAEVEDVTNLAQVEDLITNAYHSLPELMVFNAENLRIHAKNSSSPTFLALHLWYNTIIIMLYRPPLIHPRVNAAHSSLQDRLAVVNNSCLAITNILNSADLVDPFAYLASPFVNQCFFVAGSAWIQDHRIRTGRDVLASSNNNAGHNSSSSNTNSSSSSSSSSTATEHLHSSHSHPISRPPSNSPSHHAHTPHSTPHKLINSSTSILAQMAITNFKVCKKALSRQAHYWMGVRWIEAVVERYASTVTRGPGALGEGVDTFVSPAEMAIFRRLVKRAVGESPSSDFEFSWGGQVGGGGGGGGSVGGMGGGGSGGGGGGAVISEEMVRALFDQGMKGMTEDDWALAYSFASFTAGAGAGGGGGGGGSGW
ncbi:hypothetical protein V5O48_007793 [Marasmius crinis-equi]|uniref:Xylanolytic transcriptional activator regulatory domain-containing protein n=1 Tax=Marasmius crinis-equi TaxID=585013 RepID=A0ABR3FGA4_9AGAR